MKRHPLVNSITAFVLEHERMARRLQEREKRLGIDPYGTRPAPTSVPGDDVNASKSVTTTREDIRAVSVSPSSCPPSTEAGLRYIGLTYNESSESPANVIWPDFDDHLSYASFESLGDVINIAPLQKDCTMTPQVPPSLKLNNIDNIRINFASETEESLPSIIDGMASPSVTSVESPRWSHHTIPRLVLEDLPSFRTNITTSGDGSSSGKNSSGSMTANTRYLHSVTSDGEWMRWGPTIDEIMGFNCNRFIKSKTVWSHLLSSDERP